MEQLQIKVVSNQELGETGKKKIIELCESAYSEDFSNLFNDLPDDSEHVLAYLDGTLVGHAAWTVRWLQPEGYEKPLRAAYVDMVAVSPEHQNKGIGSRVMETLASSISNFEIAGLCTGRFNFYSRLGWERWLGPLYIRKDASLEPTPDEDGVMILRLPRTPDIDVHGSLSIEWRAWEVW